MSAAITAVEEDGQCEEDAWPYGDAMPSDPVATYYRARADARERNNLLEFVRTNLGTNRAVLLALRLTDAWHGVGTDGLIPAPSAGDRQQGGHAVVAVGYDDLDQRVLIRNSWGTGWGDGGHAWLPYEYVTQYGLQAATLAALPEPRTGRASHPSS